jgi:lysozyme
MFKPIKLIPYLLILCLFSCKKDTKRLVGFDIEGIDVSHHQQKIYWDSLAKKNLTFVFVKATEGMSHTDTQFDFNWNEAKRIGLKRGAYHFFSTFTNATDQARHFIQTVKLEKGDLAPVLDFEDNIYFLEPGLKDSIYTWLTMVENHFRIKPIIYTNLNLYNNFIKPSFSNYPFWIARYQSDNLPIPNNSLSYIWQYGNRGRISGINGHVDLNVFLGTQTDFNNLCYTDELDKKN